jgi:hypothetical protein
MDDKQVISPRKPDPSPSYKAMAAAPTIANVENAAAEPTLYFRSQSQKLDVLEAALKAGYDNAISQLILEHAPIEVNTLLFGHERYNTASQRYNGPQQKGSWMSCLISLQRVRTPTSATAAASSIRLPSSSLRRRITMPWCKLYYS